MKKILLLIIILSSTGCAQNINFSNTNLQIEASIDTNRQYQETWKELAQGVWFQEKPIYAESSNNKTIQDVITVFKFDPQYFNFSFEQDIENPKSVSYWQEKNQALFVCNGSYFTETNQPSGILKIEGQKYGNNLTAESVGELVIDNDNTLKIFTDASPTDYNNLMQSYPILVRPDGIKGIGEDSGQTAPRTVVAKDNNGNVLFIFTQNYYFSLYSLQNYLMASDLDIKIAINLDGGPSSGYYLNNSVEKKISESASVPNIIAVYPK